LISAGCRVDFDLDRDEACGRRIADLCLGCGLGTMRWSLQNQFCLGLVLVEIVVEIASYDLVKMLTRLRNNKIG
jgi:hypothetical protein